MILSDRDIAERMILNPGLPDRWIDVSPVPERQAMQPSSIDLRLSSRIKILPNQTDANEFTWLDYDIRKEDHADLGYPMMPGQFLLACTLETVKIPTDMVARIEGKSSWARLGLLTHLTAGYIDPGFHGQVTLELHNVGDFILYLNPGVYICQIMYQMMTSPALRPYGSPGLGSHYQGQSGPTAAR